MFLWIALFLFGQNVCFAMGKKEKESDVSMEFFNDGFFEHHAKMMKEMDLMFERQRREMIKIQRKMLRRVGKKDGDSVKILQKEECVFNVSMGSFKKEEMKIAFNDGILTILGERKSNDERNYQMGNFYYSFSVSQKCGGNPDVDYGEGKVEIKFQLRKEKP